MHTVLATMDGRPLLLAQETSTDGTETVTTDDGGDTADETTTNGSPGLFGGWGLPLILGMAILWIFLISKTSRKQRERQATMISSLKKGTKVETESGIRGSIVEVREDEAIVKVDENNNTRMKFALHKIARVLDESAKKDGKDAKPDKDAKQSKDDQDDKDDEVEKTVKEK